MSSCASIDPLVTPYVDGELSGTERTIVEDHLHRCPSCHARVAAEGAVRDLTHARKRDLTAERASASLRVQCRDLARRDAGRPLAAASPPLLARAGRLALWRGRSGKPRKIIPLMLAAGLVLLVAGAFLYQATHHSSRLLAAELAADHMKCFAANALLGTHDAPAAVERSMMSAFGWQLHLPEQFDASGLELVGSRRCLYAEGKVAHLMYRDRGRPVSIFMLPKRVRPEELVEALGHEAAIWSSGDRTFVLVTRGSRAEVQRMASLAKAALQ
jgi:anti-sigma factor RsiW